jgi:hypothetical protein
MPGQSVYVTCVECGALSEDLCRVCEGPLCRDCENYHDCPALRHDGG